MTGQVIEEAYKLKHELEERFAGQPVYFGDAVVRIAHALMMAETEGDIETTTREFAERALSKLSGRTVEPLRT